MVDYIIRLLVDGIILIYDYIDDDRLVVVFDDEDVVVFGGFDDEGLLEWNEKLIYKQLNEFKKCVFVQIFGIVWEDVWRDFDFIDDCLGNG